MSAIEELNGGVRVVASECLGTWWNKVKIVLSPDCVERRLPFPEIVMEGAAAASLANRLPSHIRGRYQRQSGCGQGRKLHRVVLGTQFSEGLRIRLAFRDEIAQFVEIFLVSRRRSNQQHAGRCGT